MTEQFLDPRSAAAAPSIRTFLERDAAARAVWLAAEAKVPRRVPPAALFDPDATAQPSRTLEDIYDFGALTAEQRGKLATDYRLRRLRSLLESPVTDRRVLAACPEFFTPEGYCRIDLGAEIDRYGPLPRRVRGGVSKDNQWN